MTDTLRVLNDTEVSISHPSDGAHPFLLKREMPGLDVLRGIAVLAVVLNHGMYWQLPGRGFESAALEKVSHVFQFGWLGVNLFFVLSGFLITGILLDTRGSKHYWKNFYVRRALRILPLYIVTLLWFAMVMPVTWGYVALCMFNMANLIPYISIGGNVYGPLWSLAVEEQFYLVWPWLIRWLTLRRMGYVCVAILVVCPGLRFLSGLGIPPLGDVHTMMWLVADSLAIGGMLAVFLRSRYATLRNARWLMGGLLGVGGVLLWTGTSMHLLHRTSVAGAAFQPEPFNFLFAGFVMLALFWGDRPTVFWWTTPLRFLGHISYGLYMFHSLMFNMYDMLLNRMGIVRTAVMSLQAGIVRFAIVFALSVLICFLSRRYFEEYFLRLKSKLAPNTARGRVKPD